VPVRVWLADQAHDSFDSDTREGTFHDAQAWVAREEILTRNETLLCLIRLSSRPIDDYGVQMDTHTIDSSAAAANSPPQIPSVAPLVAALYNEAPNSLRLRLLDQLLKPLGPLALGAVAAGAFARLLPPDRFTGVQVRLEDAMRISAGQVLELASYLEQKCPEWLLQLPDLLRNNPVALGTLSGAMLLVALRALSRRAG
jgi:hypothetical protein